MVNVFDLLLQGVEDSLSILDNLQVVGNVTVLDYLVAIVVISVIIPVLLTLVRSSSSKRNSHIERRKGGTE